jgi:hypothetical protein
MDCPHISIAIYDTKMEPPSENHGDTYEVPIRSSRTSLEVANPLQMDSYEVPIRSYRPFLEVANPLQMDSPESMPPYPFS